MLGTTRNYKALPFELRRNGNTGRSGMSHFRLEDSEAVKQSNRASRTYDKLLAIQAAGETLTRTEIEALCNGDKLKRADKLARQGRSAVNADNRAIQATIFSGSTKQADKLAAVSAERAEYEREFSSLNAKSRLDLY